MLKLYFNHLIRRYGWEKLLATVLFITTVLFVLTMNLPEHHRLKFAQQQSSLVEHKVIKRQVAVISDAPSAMSHSFYRMLPQESKLLSQMEIFFDTAFENDLYLDAVDYKVEGEKLAKFSRYRITLPISGPYTNIRKFLQQLLQKIPNASLDSISLSREDVADVDINAKLQITLYFIPFKS